MARYEDLPEKHYLPTKDQVPQLPVAKPFDEEAVRRDLRNMTWDRLCGEYTSKYFVGVIGWALVYLALAGVNDTLLGNHLLSGRETRDIAMSGILCSIPLMWYFIPTWFARGAAANDRKKAISQERASHEKARREQEQAFRERTERAEPEYQQALERTLSEVATQTQSDLQQLWRIFECAQQDLCAAQHHFDSGAFGLLYDDLATVARRLNFIAESARIVDANLTCYRAAQTAFSGSSQRPLPNIEVPPVEHLVAEAKRLVMLGETTPTCTMIWEQKRTREAVVSGLWGLHEAISDVGASVCSHLNSLSSTVSSLDSGLRDSSRSLDGVRDALEANRKEVEHARSSSERVQAWEVGTGYYVRTKKVQ